jgi:HK97 family phage portal protein
MDRGIDLILAPFRATGRFLAAVGGSSAMMYSRAASWAWDMYMTRTRIDYRGEVGDPMRNSAVSAVSGWISRNFPEAPVVIRRQARPGDDALIFPSNTGPGQMLRLLERPNPYYSGVLQWMATITDFLRGNAYWVKLRDESDRPVQLWWVPESLMEPRWNESDDTSFIDWYDYRVDGKVFKIRPRDVIHFRQGIDPLNPRKGLSRFGALFREVFTDEEASAFTASLLRNLGVPGVIIAPANTTGGSNIKTDPEAVKRTFMEKFGGDRRGEPMIMTSPTEIKVLSWSPSDMNLRDLRRIPEERISAVLGVPPGVAGLGAGLDRSTFNNFAEANRAAYTQGVIPLQRLIAAELEIQLLVDFADLSRGYEVEFDWRKASAMQEAADAVWKRYESAATKGLITRSTFKKAVGLFAEDGDDVYIQPNNYIVTPEGSPPPAPSSNLFLPPGATTEVPQFTAGVVR